MAQRLACSQADSSAGNVVHRPGLLVPRRFSPDRRGVARPFLFSLGVIAGGAASEVVHDGPQRRA